MFAYDVLDMFPDIIQSLFDLSVGEPSKQDLLNVESSHILVYKIDTWYSNLHLRLINFFVFIIIQRF